MKKLLALCVISSLLLLGLSGCNDEKKDVKIGVSLGVGGASRWAKDKQLMEDKAKELGIEIEVRLNITDEPLTQKEDCIELIDSGIDVLILTPRDVRKADDIVKYAKEHGVKVISYSRPVMGQEVDLYVGYDSTKIGQYMGKFLSETVDKGNYIILKGDINDFNTRLLDAGAMMYLDNIKDDINIILYDNVPNWDANIAKEMVRNAIINNNYKIDAILAPNDKIAEVCADVIKELGITNEVAITGMDAEVNALKRINNGKQSMTVYLSLDQLAETAINQAYNMAIGKDFTSNALFDNDTKNKISAFLVSGQLITKENMKAQIIDKEIYTEAQVYE